MIKIYSHFDSAWQSNFEKANFWPAREHHTWTTDLFIKDLEAYDIRKINLKLLDYQSTSENGYYLIHCGNSDQLLEHHGLAFITKDIVEKINNGKLKLLVAFVYETFDTGVSMREWFWYFCHMLTRVGIKKSNSVVILTSTKPGGSMHPGEDRCIIKYYPWFEASFQRQLKNKFAEPPATDFNKKTKKFINLNLRVRQHRFLLVMYLYYRKIFQDGHISWKNPVLFKNWNEILSETGYEHWGYSLKGELSKPEFTPFFYFINHFKRLPQMDLDMPRNHSEEWVNASEYYEQSWTEVINETHFDLFGDTFLTEKSFKAIFYGLPYIINGPQRQLQTLKDEGYQSFPEIFAEDYDSMPCNLNKITTVGEQMNILCYDSTKIETIKTPEIQEKLRFNQQHFWNKDHSQQIHDLLESAWDQ